ncbi:MAG TPA: YegS/Rv2252/BmrU family lipid kinase [Chitinophagaceae bacterium]|jgi:YegS/Rv2252/BmrU family lipid kinase|nr:YegS/Rv2252/BmrU family lipid kinase [Chitinophagaceae bacterium]
MNRKIVYIINPVSGTKSKSDLQKFIEAETKQKDIPFFIFPSVADGNYSFLHSIINEEKITDIVIAGGDGTISSVVGSLLNEDVDFGIIPCGSGNGLAHTAKISKQPAKALDIIFNGKASAIDGFFVNDRFACMLAGLGFDAKVAHEFADHPKRGLMTYAQLTLRNFFSINPFRFELKFENTKLDIDAFFISIANSNQFGNNFTIAPKASLSDGLLDIVIVTSQNKVSFVLQTLKQMAGWNVLEASSVVTKKSGVIYFQTDKVMVINHALAPLHIDGDPAETPAKLAVEIKKKCFRLIQPV